MNYLEQYYKRQLYIKFNGEKELTKILTFFISKKIPVFDNEYNSIEKLVRTSKTAEHFKFIVYDKYAQFLFSENENKLNFVTVEQFINSFEQQSEVVKRVAKVRIINFELS